MMCAVMIAFIQGATYIADLDEILADAPVEAVAKPEADHAAFQPSNIEV